ncbi:GDSL lipase [Mycobacterium sp. MAA66]|uniref:Rv0518 family GDSL lipase n=1 Tax=Mycobacterium sp. MAA66 TaxID=3156297 RepID=UPI003516C500
MKRLIGVRIALTVLVAVLAATVGIPARSYRIVPLGSVVERIAVVSDSYTTGTNMGGLGPRGWTALAWGQLAEQGLRIDPDVAAEGRAGYWQRGDHGSVFGDLTTRAVQPDDRLVVFFGSRNDQGADPLQLSGLTHDAFDLAHRIAPGARLLVIGPPWPTADVPPAVLQIRDVLRMQAGFAGATFIDPIAERWFVDNPSLIGADGVHPTDAGHAYLAGRIAPLIRSQLSG